MKILLIGDYSNLHACLAGALRRRGIDVTLVSDGGGYMRTANDVTLVRRGGRIGAVRYLCDILRLLPMMRGYDAVQLVNTNFMSLRPGKLVHIFNYLKRHNGSVFLTLAGDDYPFVKACMDGKMFRFSEFKIGDAPSPMHLENPEHSYGWISDTIRDYTAMLVDRIDGAMAVLPEYDMAWRPLLGDRLTFTNIPVELRDLPYHTPDTDGVMEIFVGIKREMMTQKGTGILLERANEAASLRPGRIKVHRVENLPLTEYLARMRSSHIVLDQLYSYSPATNALQAMAAGKIAGTGGQPEYYQYIGEEDKGAILTLSPFDTDITQRLIHLADHPDLLIGMSREGRRIVETHNDADKVAARFITGWERGCSV